MHLLSGSAKQPLGTAPRGRLRRARSLLVALVVGVLAHETGSASAAPPVPPPDPANAKIAYDRGLAAHKKGDEAGAARAFAEADALAPSAVALQAALEACLAVDDVALAGSLLDRAAPRAPHPDALRAVVRRASERFAGKAGRLALWSKIRGTAQLDGEPVELPLLRWLTVGAHVVRFHADGPSSPTSADIVRTVTVTPNEITTVVFEAPAVPSPSGAATVAPATSASASPVPTGGPLAAPVSVTSERSPSPPPATPQASSGGVSPTAFWILTGATSLVGLGSVLSALDTSSKHGTFVDAGCGAGSAAARCGDLSSAGKNAQLRTNVLFAVTGALAVTTGVTGAFFVRWTREPSGAVALELQRSF
jgi:hypothetical protein